MTIYGRWRGRAHRRRFERSCSRVGHGSILDGAPTIIRANGGRIEIGARFQLASQPVPSHLFALGLLRIGDDVQVGHGAAVAATVEVSIGDRTQIGPFFVVMDTDFHGERARVGAKPTTSTAMGPDSGYAPVRIGDDVRIGSHVTVLRGSIIGDGATIAAGTVVNGRILAGTHVEGVPARLVGDPGVSNDTGECAVAEIAVKVFALASLPAPSQGPDDIAEWDSLGSLKLLLALEDRLGFPLDETQFASLRSIGELQRAVDALRAAHQDQPARGD